MAGDAGRPGAVTHDVLASYVDSVPWPVAIWDAGGITYANIAFVQLTGRPAAELRSIGLTTFLTDDCR
ncbi:MAG TPA: PAS domain-containing protein, partial [Vicinamibacterales bacterium]|nr:PAS domain-containing protein [Vicinamibacterales bacterium]